jgi:hypothetical protein
MPNVTVRGAQVADLNRSRPEPGIIKNFNTANVRRISLTDLLGRVGMVYAVLTQHIGAVNVGLQKAVTQATVCFN